MTHHGDKHVDEDDDDGDVVKREEEHADAFDYRRGVVATGEAVRIHVTLLLRRVLDLDAVDRYQAEHRPEQAEERPRQPVYIQLQSTTFVECRQFVVRISLRIEFN